MKHFPGFRPLVFRGKNVKNVEQVSRYRFDLVTNQVDAQEAAALFAEEISEPIQGAYFPQAFSITSGLRPVLYGCWLDNTLVGAALVGPNFEDASKAAILGMDEYAQTLLTKTATLHALAVKPAHRRNGIGLVLKKHATFWAHQNGADIITSIPITSEALNLNKKAGYQVAQPPFRLDYLKRDLKIAIGIPSGNYPIALHVLRDGPEATIQARIRTEPAPRRRDNQPAS